VLFTGCDSSQVKQPVPAVSLSLKFAPDQTARYKVITAAIKDFDFEQPSAGKSTQDQSKTQIEMEFTQKIEHVDADGNATAKITIEKLQVEIVTKNKLDFSFDSQNKKDKTAPLAKFLGQSYTIKLTPDGRANVLDTRGALASVTSDYEKKLVKSILHPKKIAARHRVPALPKETESSVSVNSTWSHVVSSPPGLLMPKSFKKVYTLKDIDNNIVSVEMLAAESDKPVEDTGQTPGGMDFFAKKMDNTDDYTGTMKMNVATGEVLICKETLISSYVAMEEPKNITPEKGPDVLTMRFTDLFHLEKLK
jgi:hypothetical protein